MISQPVSSIFPLSLTHTHTYTHTHRHTRTHTHTHTHTFLSPSSLSLSLSHTHTHKHTHRSNQTPLTHTLFRVSDIDDYRLSVAKSLGADHVIKVTTRDPEELANQVEGILGTKPDASFECSGTDFSMAAGIYVSKKPNLSLFKIFVTKVYE